MRCASRSELRVEDGVANTIYDGREAQERSSKIAALAFLLARGALAHGWGSAVWLKPAEITNRGPLVLQH